MMKHFDGLLQNDHNNLGICHGRPASFFQTKFPLKGHLMHSAKGAKTAW